MRFLICGLGSIGRRHLRNLVALGQKDIVLHRTGKSTMPEEELKPYPVERDLSHALDRWSPDAVLVTNPTALHVEVAIPAARAGCHILLEKPISDRLSDADELERALAQGGGTLLMGFQYRHHPGLQAVKRLVAQQEVGRPLNAHAHYGDYLPDWHPWEDYRQSYSARRELGGGALLTLCHPFDYLAWIAGEVESVSAYAGRSGSLELDVEDMADVLMAHAGGMQSSVHLDFHQRPSQHWLEIVCTAGTIRWNQDDGSARWWSAATESWHEQRPPNGFDRNAMFLEEMRHFLRVIAGRSDPVCDLQDGRRALAIALAAHRAAETGKRAEIGIDRSQ